MYNNIDDFLKNKNAVINWIVNLNNDNSYLSNCNYSLANERDSLKSQNNSLSSENSSLRDQNYSLSNDNSSLRSQNYSLSSENSSLRSSIDSLNSQINSLNQTIQNLNNEIRRKDVNKNFNEEFCKFIKDKLNVFIDNIKEEDFSIDSFENEKMSELIESITNEEKFEEKSYKEVENIVQENSQKNKLVKHLNIILAGPSGVGKSSLINTVLNYTNEDSIKTGIGVPCTMGEPKYYESEKIPLLRLADTRGIEKGEYKMEDLNKSIEKFIKSQLESGNPDYFVHGIWYCITGTRLEQAEMYTLKELSKLYQSNSIPIIVVYTQAIVKQKSDQMEQFIKENFTHDFIPVLAIKEVIETYGKEIEIKPHGIDKLKEISVIRAKEAVKSSCYEYNFLKTKKEIQDIIVKRKENLIILLNNVISEKIDSMSEGKKIEEVYDDLKNLLTYLISNHIYIETRRFVTLQSENIIKNFSKRFIDENIEKFNKLFNDYIEKKSEELAQLLYDFQEQFNNNNSSLINDKKNKDQFKNEAIDSLKEKLYNRALLYFFRNCIKFICKLCVNKFQEHSEKIYTQILEKDEFHNLILKLIENDFEEINKNLVL